MNNLDKALSIKRTKHVAKDGIKLTNEFKRALILSRLTQLLLFLVMVSIACFICYLSYYAPIKTQNGYITPKSIKLKEGANIVATNSADSVYTRLKEGTLGPETIVYGEIIAGPDGQLFGSDGSYRIDDDNKSHTSNLKLNNKHNKFLNKEYIIRCSSGNCIPGNDYLFKENKIKGQYIK